jgi:hypothetical protein
VHLLLDGVRQTGTQLHRCSLQKTLEGGRLILPMNGERFERHRTLVEDIAYGGISAQEIAEKYGLSLEGIEGPICLPAVPHKEAGRHAALPKAESCHESADCP